ncbi:DoxX family protein [Roseivivax marinus]|uniref:DoxX family protein n=1 Tax=Roseivivax marinus TaxID=1379903 RepID=UPI00273E9D53|nr:DoxX family membrane protein [Roseivivax marinus]
MTATRFAQTRLPGGLLAHFEGLAARLAGWTPALLGTGGRLVFAAVLAGHFWRSALTKIEGFGLSSGAYAQIFPGAMERAGYDTSRLGPLADLVVAAGTLAEFLLPLLLIVGAFTRLAALGMIGFIVVMSLTDIFGHGLDAESIGALFDRRPDALIFDQRLLWIWLLTCLAVTGAGPVSLDRFIFRRRA